MLNPLPILEPFWARQLWVGAKLGGATAGCGPARWLTLVGVEARRGTGGWSEGTLQQEADLLIAGQNSPRLCVSRLFLMSIGTSLSRSHLCPAMALENSLFFSEPPSGNGARSLNPWEVPPAVTPSYAPASLITWEPQSSEKGRRNREIL